MKHFTIVHIRKERFTGTVNYFNCILCYTMRMNPFQSKITIGFIVVIIAVVATVFAPPTVLFAQDLLDANLDAFEIKEGDSTPEACTYTYSDWSACSINGQQTRTISSSPLGCVGTPLSSTKSCTYVAPQSDTAVQDSVISTTEITTIPLFFTRASDVLNAIVPFIIGLAILVVIWGILGYISHAGEEEKRQEAKQFIVWSIIALFIMLSIWGFVNVLVNSFALKNEIPLRTDIPSIPCIPIPPVTTCP